MGLNLGKVNDDEFNNNERVSKYKEFLSEV